MRAALRQAPSRAQRLEDLRAHPETSDLYLEVMPRVPGIALAERAGMRRADSSLPTPRLSTPIQGGRATRPARSDLVGIALPAAARITINEIALIVISLTHLRHMPIIARELGRSVPMVSIIPGGARTTRTKPRARKAGMGNPGRPVLRH